MVPARREFPRAPAFGHGRLRPHPGEGAAASAVGLPLAGEEPARFDVLGVEAGALANRGAGRKEIDLGRQHLALQPEGTPREQELGAQQPHAVGRQPAGVDLARREPDAGAAAQTDGVRGGLAVGESHAEVEQGIAFFVPIQGEAGEAAGQAPVRSGTHVVAVAVAEGADGPGDAVAGQPVVDHEAEVPARRQGGDRGRAGDEGVVVGRLLDRDAERLLEVARAEGGRAVVRRCLEEDVRGHDVAARDVVLDLEREPVEELPVQHQAGASPVDAVLELEPLFEHRVGRGGTGLDVDSPADGDVEGSVFLRLCRGGRADQKQRGKSRGTEHSQSSLGRCESRWRCREQPARRPLAGLPFEESVKGT